jgi:hypothetical protein
MAINQRTKTKIAEMERLRDEAKRHMEAAIDMAIGYKEAGCPPVYNIQGDTYGFLAGTVTPTSWYFAYRAKEEYNILQSYLRSFRTRTEDKEYSWAKNARMCFDITYREVLFNAERSVSNA